METQSIVVLDFGAQYSQLIARRIREQNVFSVVLPCNSTIEEIRKHSPIGIILSGGPSSVYDKDAPSADRRIFDLGLPVLGICYGLQILNVYRSGNLLQHIESPVNHEAGRTVPIAHKVAIEPDSLLANVMVKSHEDSELATTMSRALLDRTLRLRSGQACDVGRPSKDSAEILIPVNSSHHQAAGDIIGDGLRVVARCPEDGIIEAQENDDPDHFIVAVQWHPERSFDDDPHSRAIFSALIEAARQRHRELVGEFEST